MVDLMAAVKAETKAVEMDGKSAVELAALTAELRGSCWAGMKVVEKAVNWAGKKVVKKAAVMADSLGRESAEPMAIPQVA